MAKDSTSYLQCSYRLLDETDDVRITVLGHKIFYKWYTSKKDKEGFTAIYDGELMNTINISSKATLRSYLSKLKELGLFETKRLKGAKLYKINKQVAKKYFRY